MSKLLSSSAGGFTANWASLYTFGCYVNEVSHFGSQFEGSQTNKFGMENYIAFSTAFYNDYSS